MRHVHDPRFALPIDPPQAGPDIWALPHADRPSSEIAETACSWDPIMLKSLAHFAVTQNGAGYVIQVETDDGEVIELLATVDQIDLISSEIGQQLAPQPGFEEAGPDDAAE